MANIGRTDIAASKRPIHVMINGANITVTDIVASNGIIHVLDAVLGVDDIEFNG